MQVARDITGRLAVLVDSDTPVIERDQFVIRPNPESLHMPTKKSGSTYAELNAQISSLQAQADALLKKEVAGVVAKIRDAIAHYGLTPADLGLAAVATKTEKSAAAGGGKPATTIRKKGAPKPSARALKFKDDQGNSWGGMGKRPAWFKAALASGKAPEDLLAKG